ncbi:acyl-CoA N-acyltransferase [Trichoderma citrinoviride]|uniref:Acyl-CoA N-acyltransferase n=1 Tax=Trichoderma citrinoviride TaxID=58853 RepID=A0A2T4AZC8_9HYPO|nr:acyl-CoA N-acyltransferase [Trichoderma citrinoviride]PTB62422.1 acyl-CoA N-acyltransferase [Trichoderma citrinoviride]
MAKPTFTIKALQLEDVPEAAQLSSDAFLADRQTQMKALGRNPFNMKEYHTKSLPKMLTSPRCVILKAVDDETGEFAGFCNWGLIGFSPSEMPLLEGRIQPPEKPAAAPAASQSEGEKEKEKEKGKDGEAPSPEQSASGPDIGDDPIERLQALTGADLDAWQREVMPPGTKCLVVIGLSVSPKFQRRGIGSALLRWGTKICDEAGVFAWVHSSEPAWRIYEKAGFEVIRCLDVDLDEYAPCPPPDEGPGAKWGHYVFRYMKYFPAKG